MALFDNFKEKVTDLAQSGMAKSKQLAEIAKLKAANMAEEDAVKKAYLELGKLYYAEKGDAPEAAYATLCEKVTASKTNIAANKERIEAIKAAGAVEEADITLEEEPCECEPSCCTTEEPSGDCGCGCGESAEETTEE
ncbi:MAG: serine proteinase [Oscillospiraceae bacterium]|nr:serine proteinase [Oscillospiraceae bacterium]